MAVASAGPYANLHLAQTDNHASSPPLTCNTGLTAVSGWNWTSQLLLILEGFKGNIYNQLLFMMPKQQHQWNKGSKRTIERVRGLFTRRAIQINIYFTLLYFTYHKAQWRLIALVGLAFNQLNWPSWRLAPLTAHGLLWLRIAARTHMEFFNNNNNNNNNNNTCLTDSFQGQPGDWN